MIDGVINMVPAAKIGHIGMFRDNESFNVIKYYSKLPEDVAERDVIVVDPMLATGNTAVDAINEIKKAGVKNIKFMCIIASPQGIDRLEKAHPDVEIYCGAKDDGLDENNYIIPGLGDAGDRILVQNKKFPLIFSAGNFVLTLFLVFAADFYFQFCKGVVEFC